MLQRSLLEALTLQLVLHGLAPLGVPLTKEPMHHLELGRPVILHMLRNPAICMTSCMHACMQFIRHLRTHFLKRSLFSSSFMAWNHPVSHTERGRSTTQS